MLFLQRRTVQFALVPLLRLLRRNRVGKFFTHIPQQLDQATTVRKGVEHGVSCGEVEFERRIRRDIDNIPAGQPSRSGNIAVKRDVDCALLDLEAMVGGGEFDPARAQRAGLMSRRAFDATDGELAVRLKPRRHGSVDQAAHEVAFASVVFEEIRRESARQRVVAVFTPGLRVDVWMCRHADHVEILLGFEDFGEQDLVGVSFVVEGVQRPIIRFANIPKKLLPAAGENETDEFGVITEDLELVDRVLLPGQRVITCGRGKELLTGGTLQ